jgi:uncharacterized protein YlxW (UPF0749 family)
MSESSPTPPPPPSEHGRGGRFLDALTGLVTQRGRGSSPAWRLFVPLVLVLAGFLFVASAVSSHGTDLRAGRYGDLAGVVNQQSKRVAALREQASDLSRQVERLSARSGNHQAGEVQKDVEELRVPAGMTAVGGPGITITLDDAPEDVVQSSGLAASDGIVHQQDIQAVANALWAGGAEAMTIQNQRVISTTGIKCVGNTVRLHGVPYAPPYVIRAVGDPVSMLESVNSNPYIQIYQQYVERVQLGWSLQVEDHLRLPAYGGSPDLRYARPAGNTSVGGADGDT